MIVALIAGGLAALLHVYIFVMESILWTTPRVRATFGVTDDLQAEHTRPLAFNQGFYNLFLAIIAAVGVALVIVAGVGPGEVSAVGTALLIAGTAPMLAAALVLVLSDHSKARAAAIQGTFPLMCLVALLIATVA